MEKILVIEDEKSIRETLTDILELEGYQWFDAENGKLGILKAIEILPDLIICDVSMPEMNGHQVLKELRMNSATSNIPFIFLTALSEKKDLRKGMELGADDYLTKPFSSDEIITAVKTRLRKNSIIKKQFDDLRESIAHSLPHELRTPLVSILGYSEMLMDGYKNFSSDQIYDFSKEINTAGIRLNRLIQNYILYSKLDIYSKDKGNAEISFPKVTIMAATILKILGKIAAKYGREADLITEVEDVKLSIMNEYYNKILEELVDNAFKFSEKGSKVNVKNYVENNYYVITVSDKGRGMTAEQVTNIGAYLQFDRKKYEQQGSGLGLYLAKRLSELYKGDFNITSEYGTGTFIIIKFPLEL